MARFMAGNHKFPAIDLKHLLGFQVKMISPENSHGNGKITIVRRKNASSNGFVVFFPSSKLPFFCWDGEDVEKIMKPNNRVIQVAVTGA